MNWPGLSDSVATTARPDACPHCGGTTHLSLGLCLRCLIGSVLDGDDQSPRDDFVAWLETVPASDTLRRLGNYQLQEEIGRGGMGIIYRARERHSGRIVALKRILSYEAESRETVARFRREAQAASSLDHPNILPIYEVGESAEGVPYFSMKYAPGGSLAEVGPALRNDPRQIVHLLAKVTRAVEYAHSQGILHRDLKPGNILLISATGKAGLVLLLSSYKLATGFTQLSRRTLTKIRILTLWQPSLIPYTLDSDFVVFLGDGAGGFSQAGAFTTDPQATTLDVADLNKDGNLDLIVGGAGADNDTGLFISTFLGDGHGSFTLKQLIDLGTGSIKGEIAVADFNEDGNLDVAFFESSKLTIRGDQSTTVLTFFGDGTGNLNAGPDITAEIEPDTAVASDLNKDGHVDLVVSNRTSATVSVLLGNGDGTFTTHATIPVAIVP